VPLKPNDPYYGEFTTCSFSTGAATDADSLPVATATQNGTDDAAFALTVAKIDTGRYKITGTVPSGYASGSQVQISVAATVGGVAGKAVITSFVVDEKRVADLNDATAAPTVEEITADIDANSTQLAALAAGVTLTSDERTTLVAAIFAYVTEGTTTFVQAVRGWSSALLGKGSGLATTTAKYRDLADTKDRITATVDASGNRSAITLDLD
jgi:hypothetical protein